MNIYSKQLSLIRKRNGEIKSLHLVKATPQTFEIKSAPDYEGDVKRITLHTIT